MNDSLIIAFKDRSIGFGHVGEFFPSMVVQRRPELSCDAVDEIQALVHSKRCRGAQALYTEPWTHA